jgi:two-component system CheB/CheR fusion protein
MTSRRVLIVDDYADAAELMAEALGFAGYEVETAGTGLGALEVAESKELAAAFIDIGLPDLDGYEVARRLRALPSGKKAFLIALTGRGSESDRRRSTEAGFDLHLVKPVDLRSVTALLAKQLATSP